MTIAHPHDRFFRKTFSNIEMVEDVLFNNLPEIAQYIQPQSVVSTGESFVSSELKNYVSDMLFRAKLHEGDEAFLYILFEHKSHPKSDIAFDLLRYMVQIWEKLRKPKIVRPFPYIIPIVFYHGRDNWLVQTNFRSLFRGVEGLNPYVPTFNYYLYDLSKYKDEAIKGTLLTRIYLQVFKHIFEDDFGERFIHMCRLLRMLEDKNSVLEFLQTALEYIGNVSDSINKQQVIEAVQVALPDSGDELMPTLFEQIREEGRLEEMRDTIQWALELRFRNEGLTLVPYIEKITSREQLEETKNIIQKARDFDEVKSYIHSIFLK